MKCSIAKSIIPVYLDKTVSEQDRQQLRSHLRNCRSCADSVEWHTGIREALRSFPKPEVPAVLSTRLMMLASREHNRRIGIARSWWRRCMNRFTEMMRPIAGPLAGGISAAVLLFSTFIPLYGHSRISADVPCFVFTQPILERTGPIGFAPSPGDAVVDLNIDQEGRIVNFTIVEATGPADAVRRSIENSLLFTRFQPARLAPNYCPDCGVPMSGTIRMVFRSSQVEVRG